MASATSAVPAAPAGIASTVPSRAEAVGVVRILDRAGSDEGAHCVGEVPDGEVCVLLKDVDGGFVEVQYLEGAKVVRGFAAEGDFKNRTYRLLLNLKLNDEFRTVYGRTLDAVAEKFGSTTIQSAYKDGRTYPHLTLNYDFEVDKTQLTELIALLQGFSSRNVRVPLRMKGAGSFGTAVVFLDVDREHERYAEAMALHVNLLEELKALPWMPLTENHDKIHWHCSVCFKDFDAEKKDDVQAHVAEVGGDPFECFFDNVTIMAKVGPSEPYAGTATPVATFTLKQEP